MTTLKQLAQLSYATYDLRCLTFYLQTLSFVLEIPDNSVLSFWAAAVPPGGMCAIFARHSHPPLHLMPPALPLSENTPDPAQHTPAVLVALSPTQLGQIEVHLNVKRLTLQCQSCCIYISYPFLWQSGAEQIAPLSLLPFLWPSVSIELAVDSATRGHSGPRSPYCYKSRSNTQVF